MNPPNLSPEWARHKIEREGDGTFTIIFFDNEGRTIGSAGAFNTEEQAAAWFNKNVFTRPLPKTIRRKK